MSNSDNQPHLVLFDTPGIQDYIFATNSQRENVGASQLVSQVTTEWLKGAVKAARLEDSATIHLQLSGQALVETASAEDARRLVTTLTRRALCDAPGLNLLGVAVPLGDDPAEAVRRAHGRMQVVRGEHRGNAFRFRRLPVAADCSTTALPASKLSQADEGASADQVPRSAVAIAKRQGRNAAYARMAGLLPDQLGDALAMDTKKKQKKRQEEGKPHRHLRITGIETEWLGLVHADTNGVGQLLTGFKDPERYLPTLAGFSRTLDAITRRAFREAVVAMNARDRLREHSLLPLVVGGDDVTVLVDGTRAAELAAAYLEHFAQLSDQAKKAADDTAELEWDDSGLEGGDLECFRAMLGEARLGASAGVLITKPRFPFHAAHRLVEELTTSAKAPAKRSSNGDDGATGTPELQAIDIHLLRDTTVDRLGHIRERMAVADGGATLAGGPYLVGRQPGQAADAHGGYFTWASLLYRAAVLRPDADGRRPLPPTQMNALRDALHQGVGPAQSRFDDLRKAGFGAVVERLSDGERDAATKRPEGEDRRAARERRKAPATLFASLDRGNGEKTQATRLLDAWELVGHLPPPANPGPEVTA